MQVETIKKCRICLFIGKGKELIDWNSLVEECFEEIKTYRDCFQICTGLATTESEELPKMLCHTCATELKAVYKFIRKARKSNEKLLALEKSRKGFVFEEFSALDDFDDWEKDDVERENLYESFNEDSCVEVPLLCKSPTPALKKSKSQNETSETREINEQAIALDDSAYWDAYAAEKLYESSKEGSDKDDFSTCPSDMETCEYCNKNFRWNKIRGHLRFEHKNKSFLCHKCPLMFKVQNELYIHLETHEENRERKYICNICGAKLLSKRTHTFHVNTHSLTFEHKCDQCEKTFKREHHLKTHRKKHEHSSNCLTCGRPIQGKRRLRCNVCRADEKSYVCLKCGRKFKRLNGLKIHMGLHEGLRYTCDVCKRQYKYETSLTQHRKEHFGMPLKCRICDMGFGRRSKVRIHITSEHHIESPEEIENNIETLTIKSLPSR